MILKSTYSSPLYASFADLDDHGGGGPSMCLTTEWKTKTRAWQSSSAAPVETEQGARCWQERDWADLAGDRAEAVLPKLSE